MPLPRASGCQSKGCGEGWSGGAVGGAVGLILKMFNGFLLIFMISTTITLSFDQQIHFCKKGIMKRLVCNQILISPGSHKFDSQ